MVQYENAEAVGTPLAPHFKLSKQDYFTIEKEKAYMSSIPYSFVVGSLMYVMVCTRLNVAHFVGLVSRYLSNSSCVCVMEVVNLFLRGLLIQTWMVILITESLLQVMCSYF